ncbi:ABC transporter ATP-binding protein [Leucobacter tardus]|uniref:ABC transporter ATP-binding protein n=1 Tax=Leucobacter tardus TaxID=501483 RepID=A0A939QEP9_9MICO|nr:ABC transporter ATP-binding protein [Leucobacter tardus]MBO2990770.1 ABC transporter ATP-binding protein [Leucobacter tardus]
MPDITLTRLAKRYGSARDPLAVRDLNLTVADGEFMCVLGPSGCGKTTTLRMIAGLEHPTGGRIAVGDRVLDDVDAGVFVPAERRGMGLVFQSYALWPHLTVAQNVDFGLSLQRRGRRERGDRVQRVMRTLGIDALADRYPSELSGGQQQRVALARTLAVQPEVLLLDEPLSNLDSRLRLEMRAELKRLHDEFGTTIVFVTHDQWEAMTLATSIAVMNDGVLQQVGSPEEIYGRPANRFVAEFVGNPPINIVELAHPDSAPAGKDAGTGTADAARAAAAQCVADRDVSDAASIGFRPESVRVIDAGAESAPGALAMPATLTAVLPTGGSWILEFDADGRRVFGTTSVPLGAPVGARVRLGIDAADVHVFDRSGDRA